MKVLLIGASGFIGRRLAATLRASESVSIVTASLRDPTAAAVLAVDCDAIINLAGEPVAQRWTPRVKEAIRSSRTTATRAFFAALESLGQPLPHHYISASAIGYYGTSLDETFDERSPSGTGFLADVCVAWEHEAAHALELGMSLTIIRTGLVLGADGGALARILPIFRLGAGGQIGDGAQWYSWIHIDDVVAIYLHALDGTEGILNATSPNPVRNSTFTQALGKALHRPALIPVPPFALRLAFGEGATVILDGQRVLPTRTLETEYHFRYPTLEEALDDIVA